ncbi:hypothetical protein [Brevibacterium aurantiacum]|uniref:hypothetical protein n=1 Tax=Brevibacterium aurantiacum TaxID=273384 RepID=UPI001866C899|nr:hypothetical protein [Brevibacterium aurantiacum]
MRADAEVAAADQASSVGSGDLTLVFEDLWFAYDEAPNSGNQVLQGVSPRMDPGQIFAVAGGTASAGQRART